MYQQEAFSDPDLCARLLERLQNSLHGPLCFMEVCGTHTMAIFQSGLKGILPEGVTHLSGPGCPVCVTHDSEVAAFLKMAEQDRVIIATFGDLMRVPGPDGFSLKEAKAAGARVAVLYSPFDALELARQNPGDLIVFIGVGFETTAPGVAATVRTAREAGLDNFTVFCCHKLAPPVLRALLADSDVPRLDALLLPGHVSAVLGVHPYEFLARDFQMPSVIGGFEPADILESLIYMADMLNGKKPALVNQYRRVVAPEGNPKARKIMDEVFEPYDGLFRGLGVIPMGGLRFRDGYSRFDAMRRLNLSPPPDKPIPGCRCGDILRGKMPPDQCPLFGKACTPAKPVGPCMVSSEGSCAAYYKYSI